MLRTASSLPLAGLLTLGFDPARFQTKPPACYRAAWQLPGPGLTPASDDELTNNKISYTGNLPFCWTHERSKGWTGPRILAVAASTCVCSRRRTRRRRHRFSTVCVALMRF